MSDQDSAGAATPRPWELAPYSDTDEHIDICAGYQVTGPNSSKADWIAELVAENVEGGIGTNQANARLIVQAVNERETLIAALKLAEEYVHLWMQDNTGPKELDDLDAIEAALSLSAGAGKDRS